jgi:outer membrane protein TolC
VLEYHQQIFLERVDEQVQIAGETLREARLRYVNGLSDYLPVLTALRSVQLLEQEQLAQQKQLLTYRITLHRALGGSWPDELTREEGLVE